ncbi:MAG: hypothetical protein JSU69_02635 [Candidatus Zixiibacteriota bacterium]|nr:MAG: hypothetical protein JSU69_02635 [candidate division Zixibacteria bacterium]
MKKTIVKLAVIAILIAVLIGISVMKSSISAGREKAKIASIKEEYYRTRDSILLGQMNDSVRAYVDSIQRLEDFFQDEIDSLNRYYAERESLMAAEHEKEIESLKAQKKKKTTQKPQKGASKIASVEQKVRADYDRLRKMLPGDLTAYEKKVSINEIVVELSKKYAVSPDSIRKMLKK